ncbi:MAG: protein kinase [Deltaproteobacteria bacterium]|nr:protein kinase [Deltaproteobacteria bacterium]
MGERMVVAAAEFRGTDRFRILRRLGEGGMGIVYEAHDCQKNTKVALKTLSRPNASMLTRLKREFRALADVKHPHVVSLGELMEDRGQWFFTMELVQGVDFLDFVRPSPAVQDPPMKQALGDTLPAGGLQGSFDEERLRLALRQLAEGLHALHVAGMVHRDVKPSNVLVGDSGHLVIVDFGLVTGVDAGHSFTDASVVGTAAYMAPEQAMSGSVGPPADWYSVGIMLFEALVGVLPFSGTSIQILMDKQRLMPPPPSSLNPSAPKDLDKLCFALLQADPSKRPSGASILNLLGASGMSHRNKALPSNTQAAPFVGRLKELEALKLMLEEVREGKAVTALVEGESGLGKTSLVRRFTEAVAEDPRVAILAGRCHEREAVPYKAVDGVIDALAGFLMKLPEAEAAAVMPRRAALLPMVFPVLRRVTALAKSPPVTIADPQELRTRLFSALRELLARLAERRRLIIVIDDLQWADSDSLSLLSEILRPPEPPAMLLLATRRSTDDGSQAWRAADALPGDVRVLAMGRLSPGEAQDLAGLLIQRGGTGASGSASAIARESDGHPLFIYELVHHVATSGSEPTSPLRLEEALWERIDRLEAPAKRLLEVISVAGAPVEQEIAAIASGLAFHELEACAGVLRVAHLARTTGPRGRDSIETYHDRVRHAVLLHLDPTRRRACHGELARVLESSSRGAPEVLALHFQAAGELEKAAAHAVTAADRAMEALAFDQAARLYRLAIELGNAPRAEVRLLQVKLGHALTNAGRGKDAADAWLSAVDGASAADALDLQQKAALQLLFAGHVDQGISTIRAVLAAEGLSYPKTPKRALASIILGRARLALRGLRFRRRDTSEVSGRDLARVDACWSAGIGLSLSDHIRGGAFQARGLLLALRAGEPSRVARGIAMEAIYTLGQGIKKKAKVEQLIQSAEMLANKAGDPYSMALAFGAKAQASYLWGQWKLALEQNEQAELLFRERCVGVHWEIAICRMWITRSLYFLGRIGELRQRVADYLGAFRERGNLHGETTMRASVGAFVAMAADAPEAAHDEVRRAIGNWSRQGFHFQHYYSLYSRASLHAYQGRFDLAVKDLREEWPALRHSLLLRVQMIRIWMHEIRARALIGASTLAPAEKTRLLNQAERDAVRLAKEGLPWTTALASLLRAGTSAARGHLELAATWLSEAERGFMGVDMPLYAAAARRRRGALLGGDEGQSLAFSATAWMLGETIRNPDRMTGTLAPGYE